jgi:hypothetical protein
MPSSEILRRVALVRTDVSEERMASIIKVIRIGELGTTLAVTSSMPRLLVTAKVVPSSSSLATLMHYIPRNAGSYKSYMELQSIRRHFP